MNEHKNSQKRESAKESLQNQAPKMQKRWCETANMKNRKCKPLTLFVLLYTQEIILAAIENEDDDL